MVRRLPVIQSPSGDEPLSARAAVLLGATAALVAWLPLLWLALPRGPLAVGLSFGVACACGGALVAARCNTARLKNAAVSGLLAAVVTLAVGILGSQGIPVAAAVLGGLMLLPVGAVAAVFGGWFATRLPTWRERARTLGGKRRRST